MIWNNQPEFVIYDVETTGLSPTDGDRIIEIAGIKLKGTEEIGRFETFVDPQRRLDSSATKINKITSDMLKGAPTSATVLPQFMDFVGTACLVGHNIRFDLDFVSYELSLIRRKVRQEISVLDTLKMAKALLPSLPRYPLWFVAEHLGLSSRSDELHRAMADVELTTEVFLKLLMLAQRRHGYEFSDILREFGVDKPQHAFAESQEMLF